jgi:hypothetical protein
MLSVIRPNFEVVKEGRILHFISGYRRFDFFLKIDVSNYISIKPHQFDMVNSKTFWLIGKGEGQ